MVSINQEILFVQWKLRLLVGGPGPPRPEKYEFVNWDDDIPNINGKMPKMSTKPPTRTSIGEPKLEEYSMKYGAISVVYE